MTQISCTGPHLGHLEEISHSENFGVGGQTMFKAYHKTEVVFRFASIQNDPAV